jgi:hypothetical protein
MFLLMQVNAGIVKKLIEACGKNAPGVSTRMCLQRRYSGVDRRTVALY